jgi:hypothetical protein
MALKQKQEGYKTLNEHIRLSQDSEYAADNSDKTIEPKNEIKKKDLKNVQT